MKKGVAKRAVSLVLALAIVVGGVFVDAAPVKAATDYVSCYESPGWESASASTEVKREFHLEQAGDIHIQLDPYNDFTSLIVTLYDSTGAVFEDPYNPMETTNFSDRWYTGTDGYPYFYDIWPNMPAGDYSYGIQFNNDNQFWLTIAQPVEAPEFTDAKPVVTVGYTKKLTLTSGKVQSWISKNKKIATVDKNGKVTGKKAGKTTITATLDDGTKVKCTITVKANKYSSTKISCSDVTYGKYGFEPYSASFDSKGNLVVKVMLANNAGTIKELRNIKIKVKNASGKVVGTYSLKKKSCSVSYGSTKSFTFTIKKSALKKKSADLRNATVTADVDAWGY